MRVRFRNGLLILNILSVLLVLIITFLPSNVLRIILGIPFVLFFPGYALMAALFPKKDPISGIERVALSFGLSIAVTPLIGLILNYTPLGIRLESILYSLFLFIFVTSLIAWLMRRRLPEAERFSFEFHVALSALWRGGTRDRVLSIVLVLTILGALGTMGYVIAKPKAGQSFTEFYILGPSGKAVDYPSELKVGEEGKVIVGIANHEHEVVTYQVEVRIGGVKNNELVPVVIQPDEKWEKEVGFTPKVPGKNQLVEFLLYKNGELDPNLKPLRLWIDVTE
jgi:uncharacterized membrane protein